MQIYLLIGQERQGPFTPDEIHSKLHNGECTPETMAWKQGVEGWQPLRAVLPLPPSLATTPKPDENGANTFLDFFRAYGGLIQRIKSIPLPQPAQWYDYYPVVFPAAFLAFFFFGLGLIPLLITSRLSGGDKGRLSLIAAWPLYLAMLPTEHSSSGGGGAHYAESRSSAVSQVSWPEINNIYNIESSYTDIQKDENWTKYQGKSVVWYGEVVEVSRGIFGGMSLSIKMNGDTFTSDLLVELKPSAEKAAGRVSKGQHITFTGKLENWGTILPITLSQGEILQ